MKKIIILLIPFLLTGCASVSYNLNIERNLSVIEEVNISATKDYFNSFYMNLPITIVKEAYNNEELMGPLKNNNYKYELKNPVDSYPSVYSFKKYNSIDEYIENTVYKGQVFNEIFVNNDDNLVTITTKDYIRYLLDDSSGNIDSRFPISNLNINIKVPYVVTNSNADKVDKVTNTYTWYTAEETLDKNINITFDKNKLYIYNLSLYISLSIIVIITIIGLVLIIKAIKKNKKNNYVG